MQFSYAMSSVIVQDNITCMTEGHDNHTVGMERFTWAETEVTVTPAVDLTVRTLKSPMAPRVDCSDWPGCSAVGGKEPIEITLNL